MRMRRSFVISGAALLVATLAATAQTDPPAGATGLCKDGTYTTDAKKSGACRGHKGVKQWLAAGEDSRRGARSGQEQVPALAPNAPAAPSEPGAATTPMKPAGK